jgi:hypothetical protein
MAIAMKNSKKKRKRLVLKSREISPVPRKGRTLLTSLAYPSSLFVLSYICNFQSPNGVEEGIIYFSHSG